jgi:2-dehydropantoate 2-reductase
MSTTATLVGPRLLVVGSGGIGGVVAAHLFEQGHDVTALTTNQLIADAINANGFRVRGEGSPGVVRGRAVTSIPKSAAPFDYILLATQPPQVEEAARSVLPHLALNGAMVCFQNGLCEERIAAIAGSDRTLGAIVAWGASMVEPGVYDRTSAGGFVLGRMSFGSPVSERVPDSEDEFRPPIHDLRVDLRLDELARILEAIGPTTTSTNLAGARWSKLAINCAISSLGTVGGDRLGVLMRHRHVRRLALEIMTETVAVARALGITLEKVSGTLDLEWIALTDSERIAAGSPGLFAKHALLLAVGARYRRLRSSMLAAIERGRPPAVDFLNGEVISRGKALGIPTPINAAIREQVLEIAAGKARPSLDLMRRFFERTRAVAGAAADASYGGDVAPPSLAPQEEAPFPPAPVYETEPTLLTGSPLSRANPSSGIDPEATPIPSSTFDPEATPVPSSTFDPMAASSPSPVPSPSSTPIPPPDDAEPRS